MIDICKGYCKQIIIDKVKGLLVGIVFGYKEEMQPGLTYDNYCCYQIL